MACHGRVKKYPFFFLGGGGLYGFWTHIWAHGGLRKNCDIKRTLTNDGVVSSQANHAVSDVDLKAFKRYK